jgi:acetylornithine deacetylase/succinyl-diaminopimelate desuccinylase-like protein
MEAKTRSRLILWGALLMGVLGLSLAFRPKPQSFVSQAELFRRGAEHPSTRLFQEYLRIDTAQPRGDTKDAALFLQMALYREGIESEIYEPEPGKANLVAVLEAPGSTEPPLILHHHMDTAAVLREDLWKQDPWGGAVDKGYIYGIGAIDMKSYGICFLEAFVRARREGWPLRRPLIYLGTCAEESDFSAGSKWMIANHAGLFPPGAVMLTEGGMVEMITDRVRYVGIEVGQKAFGRFRVSVPKEDRDALESELQTCVPAVPRVHPAVRRLMRDLQPFRVNFFRDCMADIDRCVQDKPYAQVYLPGPLKDLVFNSAYWADFPGGYSLFIVSALWDEPVEEYAARAAAVFRAHGIPFELFLTPRARMTPSDTPAFSALAAAYGAHYPGVPVLPYLQSSAHTEASLFRERGVLCYGIVPVRYNVYDSLNMNLFDERVFLPHLLDGLDLTASIVKSVTNGN